MLAESNADSVNPQASQKHTQSRQDACWQAAILAMSVHAQGEDKSCGAYLPSQLEHAWCIDHVGFIQALRVVVGKHLQHAQRHTKGWSIGRRVGCEQTTACSTGSHRSDGATEGLAGHVLMQHNMLKAAAPGTPLDAMPADVATSITMNYI